MSSTLDRNRLTHLIGKLCDDEITGEELEELESLLQGSSEARQHYHLVVSLHRDLESCEIKPDLLGSAEAGGPDSQGVGHDSRIGGYDSRGGGLAVSLCLAIAASILIAVGFAFRWYWQDELTPTSVPLATVTELVGVQWTPSQAAVQAGDLLSEGRLSFAAGTLLLTYQHGVVVTVQGPAVYELVNRDHAVLHAGELVAYVPDGAEGFQVSTSSANVVDLGTEFGVTAGPDGVSEVIVFDGQIELAAKHAQQSGQQLVAAGLAYRIGPDGTTSQKAFSQSRFENARSMIRRRKVIRETFRNDDLYPGEPKLGWLSPWVFDSVNVTTNELATGIQVENPLAPGTRNYYTYAGTSGADAADLKLVRDFGSYDLFDVEQPYTIEFLMRLESDPQQLRAMKVFGSHGTAETTGDHRGWEIAASLPDDREQLHWLIPQASKKQTGELALLRDRTYRFLIEVHPHRRQWRASVSDGLVTVWNTLGDGIPLAEAHFSNPSVNTIGLQLTMEPHSELRFSLDAIRIQNHPVTSKSQ